MDIELYIPTEVESLIEGGTLLKNLLSDCKEKHTNSAVHNIQYSKGTCTFELIENKDIDYGFYESTVPCASFTIECAGVTQIRQDGTGNLDWGYHADIKFAMKKLPDKILVTFSYIHEWTQTDLFYVEAKKMKLIKYEKRN